jgi:hypothetical protein
VTGKFRDDFESICSTKPNIKFIPEVVARSRRPGSAAQNVILNQLNDGTSTVIGGKNEKKGGKESSMKTFAKQQASQSIMTHDSEQHDINEINIETIELPPKYFVVKEPVDYYKPKIQVEMDNPDKLDTVTEIHIKGWRLEKPIIEVLSMCLPSIDLLHTINFYHCGLDEEAIRSISALLPNCTALK